MNREAMLCQISEETGFELNQIEAMYLSMVHVISDALSSGEEVNLSKEWGSFIPKMWDNPALSDNSPRTRRTACYKVRFRPGKALEKQLVIPQDGDGCN